MMIFGAIVLFCSLFFITWGIGTVLHYLTESQSIPFEHRHLDRYDLMEIEHSVDTSMDEWDAEFCKLLPSTEEGKAFFNRRYKQTGNEIDKALKYIEEQTGISEIHLGIIYPGMIIYEEEFKHLKEIKNDRSKSN